MEGKALPEGWRVRVEVDQDFNPRTSVDWPADETERYHLRFLRGELTAYGVIVERLCGGICNTWVVIDSVWGCDVEASNADGTYATLAAIPDDHLREVAHDMIP